MALPRRSPCSVGRRGSRGSGQPWTGIPPPAWLPDSPITVPQTSPLQDDSGDPCAPFHWPPKSLPLPHRAGGQNRVPVQAQPAPTPARPARINPALGLPLTARSCAHSPGQGLSSCAFHVVLSSAVPLSAGQDCRAGPPGTAGTQAAFSGAAPCPAWSLPLSRSVCPAGWGGAGTGAPGGLYKTGRALVPWVGRPQVPGHPGGAPQCRGVPRQRCSPTFSW